MFRRKQDVDRHVNSILGRIKEEREKHAKSYQIARLYFEVKEYDIARRYLANFLSVRETVPLAFCLLGQIEEAVGNKENAVDAYKRFLEMGGSRKDVVLKICELYGDIGVDAGKGKYWLERAEKLYPNSDVIFKLREKLITATPGPSSDGDLEHLISMELVKKPQDVELRVKLLRLYLTSHRVEEAYTNAVDTDRTTAFTASLDWYECLNDVFQAYKAERDCSQDPVFVFHYLVVLCNLTYLRLLHKDVVESAQALHSFDTAVHAAVNMNSPCEQWQAFITEMQGQLFFMAGTLLLKRAQKGSVSWSDMRPLAAVFFLLCQTVPTVDSQATWFVRPTQDREKLYAWLYNNSFFRISQTGHTLYHLCDNEVSTWGHYIQQQHCSPEGQRRAYEALFPIRDMRSSSGESYLMNTHKFSNTVLVMPSRRQLYDVDRVAHTFHPDSLSELVWLCLQQYSFGDPHQPDYNFKIFETLQYSVKNLENGAAETLCQLDTEAFLCATVRCAALQLKEQQVSMEEEASRPALLPLCLCKKLCSQQQEEWWSTAHNFYSNNIKDNFSKMRHTLQRGVEVVRLVSNHGLSCAMLIHLAKTFDAKVKSLKEGDHGMRGSVNQLASLEARAAFYWRHALTVLSRLERNQRGPCVRVRMFDDGDDGDLTPDAIQEMVQDAKFASATIAMREGRYEEAIRGFEGSTTPYASFYRAQIYKTLAQRENEGVGAEGSRQQKYATLMAQAREALYMTMDHLRGDKNHELNILLTRELDDVESKLHCFQWESENNERDDMDETSVLKTPVKHQNGHDNTGNQPHSTPKSPSHAKSVRQRLLMSELTSDSPIHSQTLGGGGGSPSAHTRPSPERLDAQIKSINYSQSQLFKMVLDRNEELVIMYRGLLDQLHQSNAQLQTTLGENRELMEELKATLVSNKDCMVNVKTEVTETKEAIRQLKDEFQTNLAAATVASNASLLSAQGLAASQMNAAGFFMGSPYHPSQYPPYPQPPPHLTAAPGAGYRYPLLSGYPPRPTTPVMPAAAPAPPSATLCGTAPSSFGKFRSTDHPSAAEVITTTEDEEDDDENGLSACGSEYGESLLQAQGAQYYLPSTDPASVADWMPVAQPGAVGGMTYPPAKPAPSQPAVPQPGYFASALKGQSLQYSTTSMPGPGFFSTPPPATTQSAIATALASKTGVPAQQPITVVGSGATKATQPSTPASKLSGVVLLFQDVAKLTTATGDTPAVDVRIIQDTVSKQGSIVVRKKENQEVLTNHNIALVKVVSSFNPCYFLWSVARTTDRKMEDKFRLSFDSADQTKKMRTAIEQVVKSSGMKPQTSPAAPVTPAFGAKSPAVQNTTAVVSTPASIIKPPSQTTTSTTPLPSSTTTTTAAGNKATFGGFTFTSPPVIKSTETQPEEKDKAKPSPQFKLKESAIKVTCPVATTTAPSATSGEEATKPFAGFSFTPSKAVGSAFGSTASSGATASPAGQAFVFGSSGSGSGSFGALSGQATSEAFKPKEGASGFQPSPQPLFTRGAGGSPVKSPGGKEEEGVEEYEPNVDFKPIIDLPDLVEVKTGEEDETKVFSDRVKLFRFDSELNQWKERGVGELKILRAVGAPPRFRVIMRREQVLKVCANHSISCDMKLTPLSASDRAWCYTAHDFAEEDMKIEKFAVKFKNADKAGEFKHAFETCQKDIAAGDTAEAACTPKSPDQTDSAKPSLAELFKPAEGSWECGGCYVSNKAADLKCPACQTLKPGVTPQDIKASPSGGGGFKFGDTAAPTSVFGGASGGSGGGFKFGTTATPPPLSTQGQQPSLAELFKPAEGSWECGGCYVSNKAADLKCPACQTLKPGVTPQDIKASPSGGGGFKFGNTVAPTSVFGGASGGSGGGFKFGTTATPSQDEKPAATSGFKFGTPAAPSETKGFSFGTPAKADNAPTVPCSTSPSGFKFTFGTPTASTPSSSTASFVTAKPSAGFMFGGPKPAASAASSAESGAKDSGAGFTFAKPQAKAAATESEGTSALLQLLTSDDQPEKIKNPTLFASSEHTAPGASAQPSKEEPEKKGFQFTFNLNKQQTQQQQSTPKSPEVNEHGFYLNKDGEDSHIYFEPVVPLPEKVEVKTGEEEEDVLFESRAKLYRFTNNEWKERGLGVLKILQHSETGRIRLLMRREQVLKICCNHFVTEELTLKPMPRSEGKAWIWYAMDFTDGEGQMEQFAVRFRDADIANNFKQIFDESREKMKTPSKADAAKTNPTGTTPSSCDKPGTSRRLFEREDDDDVQFLYEETPTADQLARARKYLLPDTFYLYENRPPCPGCIGCDDYDPSKSPAAVTGKPKEDTVTAAASQTAKEPEQSATAKPSQGLMFSGGSGMSFSALAATSGDTPGFGPKDPTKPFHWAGAGQRLFGQGGGDGDGEDGEVAPSDDIHFEPVIPLPELIEVKTGEEDWTALFSQRSKVYRFDGTQWKERGIGDMKIMKHKSKLMFRVLLRREQVLKVACNHFIAPSMQLKPMATSETAWCWFATDYSETEPKPEQFAVKFKKMEVAQEFKMVFEDCQEKLRQGEASRAVQETIVSSSIQPTEDTSRVRQPHSDINIHDTMTSSTQPRTGDKGNPYHSQQLDVQAQDTITPSSQNVSGDRGNPYYSKQLDVSGQDAMVSSCQPGLGDQGNPYYSRQLDVATQDAQISSSTVQPLGDGGNPVFSQLLSPQQAAEAEEQYDDEDYDDDDEDDDETTEDDEDDEEQVEFDKRVTLFTKGKDNQWTKAGMGDLRVLYDDDLNANKIVMLTDDGLKLCNHIITREAAVTVDEKKKSCEWQPMDFVTDEPVRRHFKAYFSSKQATEEFATIFRQGQKLAVESEISDKLPEEIDVPEVFSTGDRTEGAAAKK